MKKQSEVSQPTRILIVDDHPLMRRGVTQLIHQEIDLQVCGEAEDVHQALEMIAALRPDLVIIDLSLKNSKGIELIKTIQERHPGLLILVLSMHDEFFHVERALQAGANGYVVKQDVASAVITAIRKILGGGVYLSDQMAEKIHNQFANRPIDTIDEQIARLSEREFEVFQSIGEGYTTRQIAEMMQLSVKTIESYKARIKEKLNLKNATELAHHAITYTARL